MIKISIFNGRSSWIKQTCQVLILSILVDDDAKSVPESLEQIGTRLRALESNQTNISGHLASISSSITDIMVSFR